MKKSVLKKNEKKIKLGGNEVHHRLWSTVQSLSGVPGFGKNSRHHFMRPAPDFRPSSLALSVADSTALIVAALTPPCSRV